LVNGLSASIDTSGGCNNSNGQAGSPVTGWVADNPGAGQSVQLFAGLEGLSTHNFYSGAYVLCLAPTDGSVSQKCSTFTVQAGTGSYPKTPPTFTGTAPTITGGADGNFIAQYSLTVTTPPDGHLVSVKVDFWVLQGGSPVRGGQTATQSVKPPTLQAAPPNIYLGYVDTYAPRTGQNGLPGIWENDPGVTFVGCDAFTGTCQADNSGHSFWDGGAVRIDNTGSVPLSVSAPTTPQVDIGTCGDPPHLPAQYSPWPTNVTWTIPAGGTLILTETHAPDPCGNYIGNDPNDNFDTSEANGNGINCNVHNPTLPVVHLTINGTAETITDSGQILNTGGVDIGACPPIQNEEHDWTLLSAGQISP